MYVDLGGHGFDRNLRVTFEPKRTDPAFEETISIRVLTSGPGVSLYLSLSVTEAEDLVRLLNLALEQRKEAQP